jgi:hypothetical protein
MLRKTVRRNPGESWDKRALGYAPPRALSDLIESESTLDSFVGRIFCGKPGPLFRKMLQSD